MRRRSRTVANDGLFIAGRRLVRDLSPTRALGLLLSIGAADLVATAILHAQGRIEERNPAMALLLARGEWSFVAAKAATLAVAAALLAWQARRDPRAVRWACLVGSGAYALLLGLAFFVG